MNVLSGDGGDVIDGQAGNDSQQGGAANDLLLQPGTSGGARR